MARIGWRSELGGWPSANSIAVMPSDQTSALVLYPADGPPEITSGAIQKGVPITVPRFDSVELICAETPKSALRRRSASAGRA